jgi:hypothetical protein
MRSEEKLSRLQRWILLEAYRGILKAGTEEPTKERIGPWITTHTTMVHLLRVDVFRDYFGLPVRKRYKWTLSHNHLVLDGTVDLRKAHTARSALTRSLTRLKKRGLISDDITLTSRGIEVAKELAVARR